MSNSTIAEIRALCLPERAVPTGVSPKSGADDLPSALRQEHRTKSGTYGLLVVLAGSLDLVFATAAGGITLHLSAGDRQVLEPQQTHYVVPGDGMRTLVEFHAVSAADCLPGGSDADPKEQPPCS
ncbi:MAG: DUF1971 domain-containing protein [Planctomycetota bacterium]